VMISHPPTIRWMAHTVNIALSQNNITKKNDD